MNYHTEQKIKKMMIWRLVSIFSSLVFFWIYTGSFFESCFLSFAIYFIHSITFFAFANLWEKYIAEQ